MKVIPLIFSILLFCVPIKAQFASFDLSDINTEEFEEQIQPFLKIVSISNNRHFINPIEENSRVSLGVSYSQGINFVGDNQSSDLTGGYPNLAGALVITENLLLKGNISTFKSNNDVVQSFAYGFGLNLTNTVNNNWQISVLFSQLRGPDDLKFRAMDAAIIKEFEIGKIQLFTGLGLNNYNAKILLNTSDTIPNSIKGNANYLLLGARLIKSRITVVPFMQINSNVTVLSVEISGIFK